MNVLLDPTLWMAFAMLTTLEIVLGIDNILFLTILVGRLPASQRQAARRAGLAFAMITRIALLLSLNWVMGLRTELLVFAGHGLSGRDLVLLGGGVFLLYKASREIFEAVERGGDAGHAPAARQGVARLWSVIAQIAVIDIVFSLDSVITAVGMADHLPIMIAAVVIAILVMLAAADPTARFVNRHPTVKMLALAFLLLVGMALVADAAHFHIPRGYLYAAIAFSAAVEGLNLAAAAARRRRQVRTAAGSR